MDWLILILAVPAIIVPVVLLFGFSGCGLASAPYCAGDEDCDFGAYCSDGNCNGGDEGPSRPEGLSATSYNDHSISLTWTNLEPAATGFQIERTPENGVTWEVITPASIDPTGTLDTDTAVLKEGLTFIYRVSALIGSVPSQPSDKSPATVLPATPTNLVATVVNSNEIDLSWTNASTVATEFSLADQLSEIYRGSATAYSHMNPGPDVHSYQVSAIVPNGSEDNTTQDVFSELSSAVAVSIFTPAFTAPPGTLTTDGSGAEGFCIVQRLASTLLLQGGTNVRITLRGSTTGSLTLDRVTISQVAASGDPYDSATDLVTVATAVTLAPNTPQTIGPVGYFLDATKDLLVAFDVSATPGQGNVRYGLLPGGDTYSAVATSEAGVQDRTSGYAAGNSYLNLIDQIEVA